jgi:peptide/nickel transport system permease protein
VEELAVRATWARWVAFELVGKTLALVLALTVLVGGFLFTIPGKVDTTVPVRAVAARGAAAPTPEAPGFATAYGEWLGRVGAGQLGRTTRGYPVAREVAERLPVTAGLALAAGALVALGAALAALFELQAGHRRGARVGVGVGYALNALPTFLVAYVLFGLMGGRAEGWTRFVAPVLVLAAGDGLVMEVGRMLAGGVTAELARPYAALAFAKGLPRGGWLPRAGTVEGYAFRQALILVLPRTALQLQVLIGLALLVEKMFSLQGLSDMLLDGLGERDVNRVMVVVLALALLVRAFGLANDAAIRILNPRARTV